MLACFNSWAESPDEVMGMVVSGLLLPFGRRQESEAESMLSAARSQKEAATNRLIGERAASSAAYRASIDPRVKASDI